MADASKLIVLNPTDTLDDIGRKIRAADAGQIEVLVPAGVTLLRQQRACEQLQRMAGQVGADLMIYTIDDATIRSAEACGILVIPVEMDLSSQPASKSPSERRLGGSRSTPRPTTAPTPAASPTASTSEDRPLGGSRSTPRPVSDDEFLRSLEEVPQSRSITSPRSQTESSATPSADQDAAWAAALGTPLETASDQAPPVNYTVSDFDDDTAWASAFDDLSDAINTSRDDVSAVSTPQPQRVRPEDIELTTEDMARQPLPGRRDRAGKAGGRPRWLVPLLGVLLLGGLGFGIWWFGLRNQAVTVVVRPPAQNANITTYEDVRINYTTAPVSDTTSTAVQARLIEAPVTVSVQGTVLTPTVQPDAAATGYVQVYNRNPQAYTIPVNTRVSVITADGTALSYYTTAEIVVPPATGSLAGTTSGVANIPIAAASGGETYNLDADAQNTRWQIEGYEGALLAVNPEPISGGTNTLLKIPSQADIQPLLNQAVPLFKNQVIVELQKQLQPGEQVAGVQFWPNIDELAQNPNLYQINTQPIPGSDGDFNLILTADFRGLAVPADFARQLERALPLALRIKDPGINFDTVQIVDDEWRLPDDPGANLILATVQVAPKSEDGLSDATRQQISASLAGQTPQQARTILEQLQEQGVIGGVVTLPTVEQLPTDPARISIEVEP